MTTFRSTDPIAEARARIALRYKRAQGLRPPPPGIGALATKLARAALPDKGAAIDTLKARWPDAVGEQIAKYAVPEKIAASKSGRFLVIRVIPSAAPLIQHQQTNILARNSLAGAGQFDGIRIVQGPLSGSDPVKPTKKRALSPSELTWLHDSVKPIEDASLRAATIALGKAVLSADSPQDQKLRRSVR